MDGLENSKRKGINMRKVLGKIRSIDLSCKEGRLGLFIYFDLNGGKSGIADHANFIW